MKIVDDNLVWMYEPSTTGTNKDVETIITGDTDSDYVKVVRCKQCRFYEVGEYVTNNNEALGYCYFHKESWWENEYCSHGKRRETE